MGRKMGSWGLPAVWIEEPRVCPTCLVLVSGRMVEPTAE